jgi:FKBP-type peptidyl-prolyl cis-trans isomerase
MILGRGAEIMHKTILALAALVVTITLVQGVSAQGGASKAPPAGGPTKVTGDGAKTSSGLQYWDIKEGTGRTAEKGQRVKVHYTGWLTNGKKFDSSVGGQPFGFRIGGGEVIKGWEEGVTGMKVGGKRQLRIPPSLAYGAQGYPGAIPPNATLVFDIELLRVE